MIVRAVLSTGFDFDRFDFFNDAQDTLNWLARIDTEQARFVQQMLQRKYTLWIKNRNK